MKSKIIQPTPTLIDAVFDLESGEVLLAHPSEFGVYLKPEQYKQLFNGIHSSTHVPVYTPGRVGSIWFQDPSTGKLVCTLDKNIRTCEYVQKPELK